MLEHVIRARKSRTTSLTTLFLIVFLSSESTGQQIFHDLGTLATDSECEYSRAAAISADGTAVTGTSGFGVSNEDRAFRWTTTGGMISLGTLGSSESAGVDISADGNAIVGSARSVSQGIPSSSFRWTTPGGMQPLSNTYEFGIGDVLCVSGDGLTAAGAGSEHIFNCGLQACLWQNSSIIQFVGPCLAFTLFTDTNFNGDLAVGIFESVDNIYCATRWSPSFGFQCIPNSTFAYAVSDDGNTILINTDDGRFALWTQNGGHQIIEDENDFITSEVRDLSGDGTTVAGSIVMESGGPERAAIWRDQTGWIDLTEQLEILQVDISGWVLTEATGLSFDGNAICGNGKFNNKDRAWVIHLPVDQDNDGLIDDWEINGIPYIDSLGQAARYLLPGADPMRANLYVEVDSMSGFAFPATSKQMVVQAFSNSPWENPDGTTGIDLVVDTDEMNLPHVEQWEMSETPTLWPSSFDNYKQSYFGTSAERLHNSSGALLDAKAKAYRYCIVTDQLAPQSGGNGRILGIARAIPSDEFVIGLGYARFAPTAQFRNDNIASLFMHELGHCVGLGHGGKDNLNGKINYPSIMNYSLTLKTVKNHQFWELDYSREGINSRDNSTYFSIIDEANLDECAGVGVANGIYENFYMPFGVTINENGDREMRLVRLNGDCVDFGDFNGTHFQDGLPVCPDNEQVVCTQSVSQDLNFITTDPSNPFSIFSVSYLGDKFRPYDDWDLIRLATLKRSGLSAPATIPIDGEITDEAADWLTQNTPASPSLLVGDCNCDFAINGQDVSAFILAISDETAFSQAYPDCETENADTNNDGEVNIADIQSFVELLISRP